MLQQNILLQNFIKFAINKLQTLKQISFNSYPKIVLTIDKSKVETLASFNPNTNEIICYTPKRLVADVFRSIAHELVHFAQNMKQELTTDSGTTGSNIENEANSIAGVILREFTEQYPEILTTSFDEMILNKSETNLDKRLKQYSGNLLGKFDTNVNLNGQSTNFTSNLYKSGSNLVQNIQEYAQNILNKLYEKFKAENTNLTDDQINYYINRFDQLKSSPKVTQKDILKYSFTELEKLVDVFPTKMKSQQSGSNNDVVFSDGELIYDKSPLQILHGDSPKQCIKIKGDFSASWCIARTSGNMYHNYRFGNAEPSFYFVKNLERLNRIGQLQDDPYCFFVVQINNQGKFIVTSALNHGDKEMTWQQLLSLEPLLQGTEKLFIQKALSDTDRYDYKRFIGGISDKVYQDLSFDDKKKYISITNKLNDDKFENTPDEILNDYITLGVELTLRQYDFIKNNKQLVSNYRRVTLNTVVPEYLKKNISMGSRWQVLSDQDIIDIYQKYPTNMDDILRYKPNLIDYFKDILSKFDYDELTHIIIKNPSLITYFKDRLSELNFTNIDDILHQHPKLIEYFEDILAKTPLKQVIFCLKYNPRLIIYFKDRLHDINSEDVSKILDKQPQLAKYFNKTQEDEINELNQLATNYLDKCESEIDNRRKPKLNEDDKVNRLAKSHIGYRAGHIEGRKPEDMQRMDSNRHTGHFGTGYYFFGDSEQANKYSKATGDRDVREVNFGDYRLFVPDNEYDAIRLHDFFKKLNNNDYSYEARKKAFDLITSDKISIYLRENNINFDRYAIKDIIHSKDVFEQYFYDNDRANVIKELSEDGDDRNLPMINGTMSYVDNIVRPKYKSNLNDLFLKQILPTLNQLNKNKSLSKEQATNVAKLIFSDYRIKNHSDRNNIMSGKDTLSTRIMKLFGWEGIDVRGTKLDNSEYGSVIYDIKPSSIIKEESESKSDTGCLMLDLKFNNWNKFLKQIPDDILYTDDGIKGKETEPHCTVLYGFDSKTDVDKIKKSLQTLKSPIKLSLNKINLFENEKFDVIKFNIVSTDLNKLHQIFKDNFANTETYDTYTPHVTIAYVKKGFGKKFVTDNFNAIDLESGDFTYSLGKGSEKTLIQIGGSLQEYAQNILNKLAEKFKAENPNLTDEQINYYINRFDQLKSSPKVVQKDILKYTFTELEKLVDSFPTKMKSQQSGSNNDVVFSDGELIYDKSPLQILHGDSPKQCIKIKGDFSASWCIARTSGNMYHNYRFGNAEPSFYFVKNLERLNKIKQLSDDPYCFFVVQINNQGKFIVTSALNNGDKEMSWKQLVEIEPLLQGTKKLFTQKALSDEDKADYERFNGGISDDAYNDLSFDEKKKYISITNKLSDNQFENTPDEILNDYITTGVELPPHQFEFIKNKRALFNNYRRVTTSTVLPEFLEGNITRIGYRYLILTDRDAIEIYDKKPNELSNILKFKPTLLNYFEDRLSELNPSGIVSILCYQPNLINLFKDRLAELNSLNIINILQAQPNLINFFKDRLPQMKLTFIRLLIRDQPNLINYVKDRLSEFDALDVNYILRNQPQLAKYFNKTKEDDLKELIKLGSELLNECDCDDIEDDEINELVSYLKQETISEALYQGRSITLNKPTRGDTKKFKVYVKNKSGKIVKVNFGSKDYNIKKNNPDRKKSYCARSKGIEGGGTDKTKANYWSRRAWKC